MAIKMVIIAIRKPTSPVMIWRWNFSHSVFRSANCISVASPVRLSSTVSSRLPNRSASASALAESLASGLLSGVTLGSGTVVLPNELVWYDSTTPISDDRTVPGRSDGVGYVRQVDGAVVPVSVNYTVDHTNCPA